MSATTSPILEFEAPSTADSSDFRQIQPLSASRHKRPFSIDLSLELERQLESEAMESPASTPAHDAKEHNDLPQRVSLDPHVLAHIVVDLRHSLADITKERDALLSMLSKAHTQEAQLTDAMQLLTDKATSLEEEVSESRKKLKDNEESISMLRNKVEESRRGLMRLQTENRRSSIQPLDTSRASIVSFASSTSTKRQSFTPLTGSFGRPSAHKRISSVSDSAVLDSFSSPHSQVISLPDSSPQASRRLSGLFGRTGSPPHDDTPSVEIVALKREIESLKAELDDTRRELTEATEAKDASDTCVKALREFIATNNVGGNDQQVGVPLLPSSTEEPPAKAGGWGFKLWKVDTSVKPHAGPTSSSSATPTSSSATPTAAAPLSRKFTGLFGMQTVAPAAPSSTETGSPPSRSQAESRDSVYSASDASSVTEPLSPLSDTGGSVDVVVSDATAVLDAGSNLVQEQRKGA
ncbi:hypothetical protein K435DRAFT_781959 [Dendrothele bispora CBS 962.96]|uniref:Uncharacterized protein n=1 Tax=Dendrothele bispora (strain CBS 962.96) TaxID=1314807 RepID=A0A4S8LHT5_DENBC|nr:hypothetical protein K435DRAFT_781959 [Dendrothele bispora CBS 962.96]